MSRRRARHRPAARLAGLALAGLLALFAGPSARPAAQPLVADLSDHLIAIDTDFTGREVVLFGALDEPGDVVVVVRGPDQDIVVRQKQRRVGIWMNVESMPFVRVPSFYGVAASRSIADIAPRAVRERYGIGVHSLRLDPEDIDDRQTIDYAIFRRALIEQKQDNELFGRGVLPVAFLGEQLFRANIVFPANVPTGQYTVSVYLLRDGAVVSAQTTPLAVNKVGLGATVFTFAHTRSAIYGGIAILIAVAAGWLAGIVFRRS